MKMVPCLITEHVNMLLLLLPFIENWLINDREVSSALWNDSRIIGWQLDNEPAVQFDYNPKAELAFRDFLREKISS